MEKRLGERWDPVWETPDVPYAYYEVLKGQKRIGWVFGANQGWPGADNAQIIVAANRNGRIRELFFQKLPSLENEKFQNRDFYKQFIGLTLQHFYIYEALKEYRTKNFPSLFNPVGMIKDPSEKEHKGFEKILRGTKKILILFDEFWSESRVKKEKIFEKVELLLKTPKVSPHIEKPLTVVKKFFREASRVVAELLTPADRGEEFRSRFQKLLGGSAEGASNPLLPILLAYRADNYKKNFVRGVLLGYVILLVCKGEGREATVEVAVDKKGRILRLVGEKTEFDKLFERMKGVSLTNFYVNEAFKHFGSDGGKVDKLGTLMKTIPDPERKKKFATILRRIKEALILFDEFYLNNYYKKDKIFKLVEKYLKKKR